MGKPVKTLTLRGLATASYFVAAWVMLFSHQTIKFNPTEITAKYSDWSGFVFVAAVSCIVCLYNILLMIFPSGSPIWKTIIVLDVIANILVGSCLGAGWQTFWLIINGDYHTGWAPICKTLNNFCVKTGVALGTCSFGFFFSVYLLMCTLSVSVDPFLIGGE